MTLDDQMQAYLDGTASEADMQVVAAALRADRSAADLLARHTLLRELLEDEYAVDYLLPAEPLPAPTAAGYRPTTSGWLSLFTGTVALFLLVGLAGAVWRLTILPNTPPAATVAIVAAVSPDVRWQKPAPDLPALARGTSLPAGSLELGGGQLSLLLASGVELTLDGPAHFDLCTDMHVQLHTGKLSAVVPEPARGFLVEAQGLRVVDLGTEFEVVAPPSGKPEVAVLRGSVEASFVNADQAESPLRLGEAERHRFNPATRTSESLGTAARPAASPGSETAEADRQAFGHANALAAVGTESQRTIETPTTAQQLDLGGPGNVPQLTVVPGGSVSVNQLHAAGNTQLHIAGGMFTLADARDEANVCLAADTHLELIVSDGYLTCEKVVRWAALAKTEVTMELTGGLVEARRAFVLSERGRGSLLQTGGQFRIQNNLFINSQDPARATRYTIRGGQLLGSGTLRLGDWRANDGLFRIEGTQPEIHIGGLAVASDRAVLEYLLDEQGVSPFVADRQVMLGDRGTLQLIARPGAATLPSQVVLMRYSRRQGQFARVELNGLQGEVVYDDEAGEVRLEQIKP